MTSDITNAGPPQNEQSGTPPAFSFSHARNLSVALSSRGSQSQTPPWPPSSLLAPSSFATTTPLPVTFPRLTPARARTVHAPFTEIL